MSKRLTNREKLLTKLNNLSESEIGELLNYISMMERGNYTNPETPSEISEDELLMALSSARENRRARQVFEWESIRRRAEARASVQRYAQR
jgi:hypothetical protein